MEEGREEDAEEEVVRGTETAFQSAREGPPRPLSEAGQRAFLGFQATILHIVIPKYVYFMLRQGTLQSVLVWSAITSWSLDVHPYSWLFQLKTTPSDYSMRQWHTCLTTKQSGSEYAANNNTPDRMLSINSSSRAFALDL